MVNTQKSDAVVTLRSYQRYMGVGARIEDRLGSLGWSQAELARRVGVTQQTIWKLVSGQSQTSKHLRRIAQELETTEEYLLGQTDQSGSPLGNARVPLRAEQSEEPANSVQLPQLEIGYSMGGGSVFSDYQQTAMVPFPRDWLRPMMRGTFADLFVARGDGDSMMPTLLDGDLCIVDTSQRSILQQDRLWCLSYGDLGMIKRVRMQPDGGALIISDNPAIENFTAYDEEMHAIGRVIWIGRRV